MAYMVRTRAQRADLRHVLRDCRSVVAVAMSYRTSLPASRSALPPAELPRVWVSRYAWGRDYHRVMKRKLVRLGRWLAAASPGAGWRACVDTAPVLEREWAARAGLGWLGKNTQLIDQKLGSELFLGLLLTDVELTPDAPVADCCGRCSACLDACPSRAFSSPHVLDARRCIGYLTVEHRGQIPAKFHTAMGSMVAGCDICQEVCPWTARAPADLHPEFLPARHRYRPCLEDLERLDERTFREWRSGSPLTRIPFEQFQRTLRVTRANLVAGGGSDGVDPRPGVS